MQPILSSQQIRDLDRLTSEKFATPSLLLMEAAAEACLRLISQRFDQQLEGKKAQVLCGPGNNGGDGAAIARGLARLGVKTDVVLFGSLKATTGEAETNFKIVQKLASFEAGSEALPAPLTFIECDSVSKWETIARPRQTFDLIVDALFGTGLKRPLKGVLVQVVQHIDILRRARERSSAVRPLIISVDVPSGLNSDLSEPIGPAIRADVTVTFTAPKPANVLTPAAHFCGDLVVADIGSPQSLLRSCNADLFLIESKDAREWLVKTRYAAESYKNTHGHALLVAGSRDYSGAAALCSNAAMRSGAGLVTTATPVSAQALVAGRSLEEVITRPLAETDRGAVSDVALDQYFQLAEAATAVAIGPGLTSEDERTRSFVKQAILRRKTPMVLDADGLNCLAPWPNELKGSAEAPLILTPHPGEMRRLLGGDGDNSLSNRVETARKFATKNQVIVVLKGSRALIAAPDGRVFVNPTGNAGLGTAGSGDTLTGLVCGFLAQSFASPAESDALAATLAALFVGGLAGELAAEKFGLRTMIASDIRDQFGVAIRALDEDGEVLFRSSR